MIFSRHKQHRKAQPSGVAGAFAAMLVCGVALVVPSVAFAQSSDFGGAPISIIPQGVEATEEAPSAGDQPSAKATRIISAPLTNLDPAAMGTLTVDNGGFRSDMWSRSEFGTIATLLPKVPANTQSPTMQILLRRLALTTATPPAHSARRLVSSEADAASEALAGSNRNLPLLRARIDRLYQAGAYRLLASLFKQLPPLVADGSLAQAEANVMLLAGDTTNACAVSDKAALLHEDLFWLHLQAFCKAQEGDYSGASFAVDMARELGEKDAAWLSLMRYLILPPEEQEGRKPKLPKVGQLTPLILSMARAASIAVPFSALKNADAIVLHALARDRQVPQGMRIEAGQSAAKLGAIDGRSLANVYATLELPPLVLERALKISKDNKTADADATIYRAAQETTDPTLRLQLLEAAWTRADQPGNFVMAAQTYGELAQTITPSAALVGSAPTLARTLMASGNMQGAIDWYMILRGAAAARDPNATTDLIGLWPLIQLAAASKRFPWSSDIMEVWWQAQAVHPSEEQNKRGLLVFSLFETLDQPIPQSYWLELIEEKVGDDTNAVPFSWLARLREAASQRRLGETVMLALMVLGDGGPATANIATINEVVRSLATVGLTAEARSLALEAMLGNGL